MENINSQILQDYQLLAQKAQLLKAEVDEKTRALWKLRKAFNELLEVYQEELDRRGVNLDRDSINYDWCEKAGILD
jgi:hypothetical protein